MCRLFTLAVLVSLGISSGGYADDLAKDGIRQVEGTIVSLKRLRSGDIKLTFKPSSGEAEEVTVGWKTMIYQLTKKNTELFAKAEEEERFDKVYGEMNNYWQKLRRLPEGRTEERPAGWQREEDGRRMVFGPPVKLVKSMEAYFYVDKDHDITYAVLVKHSDKTKNDTEKKGRTK